MELPLQAVLSQTVPMIIGANVGSTLSAQIIAFGVSRLVRLMLALGLLGYAFAKSGAVRLQGSVLFGLGLLFLGIQFMGDATRPLRTFQPFIDAMQDMRSPWLGIVCGVLMLVFIIPGVCGFRACCCLPHLARAPRRGALAAETPRQVADAHTIFSVASTQAFIWFTGPIARLAQWIAPEKKTPAKPDTFSPRYLDEAALEVPALATQRVRRELEDSASKP